MTSLAARFPSGSAHDLPHTEQVTLPIQDLMPNRWPPLPFDDWQDTYATLHLWTQIVGKVCLALTPLQNHFWNITFRLTPRGLVTPTLFHGERRFTMLFDFVAHELRIQTSDGSIERLALEPGASPSSIGC